jgi:hypothetical protein
MERRETNDCSAESLPQLAAFLGYFQRERTVSASAVSICSLYRR